MTAEEWVPIVGFGNYAVSNLGRIRRVVPDRRNHICRILTPWINNKGYEIVALCQDDSRQRVLVHRIVCGAFHGPSNGLHAAHNDGVPLNNRADNLRWVSRAENMADCIGHGTRISGDRHWSRAKPKMTAKGEAHGRSKITENDVRAIRAVKRCNGSGRALAEQFGISTAAISRIRSNKIWRHIT